MAKLKMLKMPKKPAKRASVATKEKWLDKVAAIRKDNAERHRINEHSKKLDQTIAGIGSVIPSQFKSYKVRAKSKGGRKKSAAVGSVKHKRHTAKKHAPKKHAAKKHTAKKRR